MITTYLDLETRALARSQPWNGDWPSFIHDGGGGISALVTITEWDGCANEDEIRMWDDQCLDDLVAHLERADTLVTFNGIGFDLPVVGAHLGYPIQHKNHIDICALIKQTSGKSHGSYSLDNVSKRTIGRGKSGHGASAPALAAQNRFAELFQYCYEDVRLTRDLWHHIQQSGTIIGVDGETIAVYDPQLR